MKILHCNLKDIVVFFESRGEFGRSLNDRNDVDLTPVVLDSGSSDVVRIAFDPPREAKSQLRLVMNFTNVYDSAVTVTHRLRYRAWFWYALVIFSVGALMCLQGVQQYRSNIYIWVMIGICLFGRAIYWGAKKEMLMMSDIVYEMLDVRFNGAIANTDVDPMIEKEKAIAFVANETRLEERRTAAPAKEDFFYEIKSMSSYSRVFSRCYYKADGQKICVDESFGDSNTKGAIIWEGRDTKFLVYWSELEIDLRVLEGFDSGTRKLRLPAAAGGPGTRIAYIQGGRGEMKIYTTAGKHFRYDGTLNGPY